jgi:hypothetical protein
MVPTNIFLISYLSAAQTAFKCKFLTVQVFLFRPVYNALSIYQQEHHVSLNAKYALTSLPYSEDIPVDAISISTNTIGAVQDECTYQTCDHPSFPCKMNGQRCSKT